MEHNEHADCGACCAKTESRPPNRSFWGLIAAFWVASLGLGFAASQVQGWGFVLFFAWAAMATSVVLLARRATSWTCADCGSAVAPPAHLAAPPLTGFFRGTHARRA